MNINITLTEQLILGILSENSAHGYNIEKLIEERDMRKWTDIGFSSIYYVLDKLEQKGLAVSKDAKGKEKKEYSITELGLNILKSETKRRLIERKPANTDFMTGLANSHLITLDEMIGALKERKNELEYDLLKLKEKMSEMNNDSVSAMQLFSLSKKHIEAEIEWINEEIKRNNE